MSASAFNPVEKPSFLDNNSNTKLRTTGFLDWLFGPAQAKEPATATEPIAEPTIRVAPPIDGNFWVESFFNALTEATTLFAKRHVELVHQEDPLTVFKVREVKIECKDAPSQFHRDVLSLPALVRNRVVKSRMQKAPGSEYLMLNDFFGSTIAADITLIEGQIVQTMVSYSGSRFVLKFAFEGDYVTRPESPPVASPISNTSGNPSTPPSAELVDDMSEQDKSDFSQVSETPLRSRHLDKPLHGCRETPLHSMATSEIQPLANLRLRSLDQQVVVPLMEDNFPYTIGRHSSFQGYCVCGQRDHQPPPLLHETEPADFSSFVSREHIVLHGFDTSTQQFRVASTKGKNGSFFKAAAMPSHFLLPLSAMAKGEWLKLGGTGGNGILEIRIEAV